MGGGRWSGWQFGAIFTYQSANLLRSLPFDSHPNVGEGAKLPNLLLTNQGRAGAQFFDTLRSQCPPFSFGNEGIGLFGPSQDMDLSLIRTPYQ
jgi:hypothetical protein